MNSLGYTALNNDPAQDSGGGYVWKTIKHYYRAKWGVRQIFENVTEKPVEVWLEDTLNQLQAEFFYVLEHTQDVIVVVAKCPAKHEQPVDHNPIPPKKSRWWGK